MDSQSWAARVIPLPKELSGTEVIRTRPGRVRLHFPRDLDPGIRWTIEALYEGIAGAGEPELDVVFLWVGGDRVEVSPATTEVWRARDAFPRLPAGLMEEVNGRIESLKNAEQAYAIRPFRALKGEREPPPVDRGCRALLCAALTAPGLLNAARTLRQLVADGCPAGAAFEVPLAVVTDWPDLAERGQWGGNSEVDMAWTGRWKLNVLEAQSEPGIDPAGAPVVKMDGDLIRRGRSLGVNVVPRIIHLEQLSSYAGLMNRKEAWSVPDPAKPLPSDYVPGLCMSSRVVGELLTGWLRALALRGDVTDIMVWLSEHCSPCFCPRCIGKEPYELEVAAILSAYRVAQRDRPGIRLRLLTSQGSYPVNDKILAIAPSDVGVSYYDGGRTYDSSRAPMIYPLLEAFARSGRWLGCYPQITHCWRAVFPWTGPQFIRARAREFVTKGLSNIIGYAVPSNRFHEFNVMALAEWSWNGEGRSVEDFCRAYALRTRIADPDLFTEWAAKVGQAGWVLAESRLLLTLIYNPTVGLSEAGDDHRFEMAKLHVPADTDQALSLAREALELARRSDRQLLIDESECLLAGLTALTLIGPLREALAVKQVDSVAARGIGASLDRLDETAITLYRCLIDWGHRITAFSAERLPTRLLDTACVLFRVCDAFRARAEVLGIADPRPEMRMRRLGTWSAADFAAAPETTLTLPIGALGQGRDRREGAEILVGFDYIDSAYGTDIVSVRVLTAETPDILKRVSIWEPWCEVRLTVPPLRADRKEPRVLEIRLRGFPADAPEGRRTCSGSVGLRMLPAG